jgi:hypothetical protein
MKSVDTGRANRPQKRQRSHITGKFTDLAGAPTQALDAWPAARSGEVVIYKETGQIDFALQPERRSRYPAPRQLPRPREHYSQTEREYAKLVQWQLTRSST